MNRTKEKKYILEIVIATCLGAIAGNFGNYTRWVILICLLCIQIIRFKGELHILPMYGTVSYSLYIMICFIGGLWALLHSKLEIWPFVRDIILVTTLPIAWAFFCNTSAAYEHNKSRMWSTVYASAGMLSVFALVQSIPKLVQGVSSFSGFVAGIPYLQWPLALGIYLFVFHPPEIDGFYITKRVDRTLFLIQVLVALLSFSRIFFVILFCLILPSLINKKRLMVILKLFILLAICSVAVYILLPEVAQTFWNKVTRSLIEVGTTRNWTEEQIVWNWRGYEVYSANLAFSKYNTFQMLFGKGFGASVATPYARLVTGESALAYLHNGYYTSLIKGGIIGLGLHIMLFVSQFVRIVRDAKMNSFDKALCLGIILAFSVTSIVGGDVFFGSAYMLPWLIFAWITTSTISTRKNSMILLHK